MDSPPGTSQYTTRLHNISPSYLSSMYHSVNPSRRCLRSAARGDLVVPATKTVCYSPRSFIVARLATWNSLPASVHDDQLPVTAFCHLLKTVLFSRAHDSLSARLRLFLLSQWANITLTKYCCCCYCYYYNPLH